MAHMCLRCSGGDETVEFPSVKEYLEHEAGGHVSRPKKILPPSPPVTPSSTEIAAGGPTGGPPAPEIQPQATPNIVNSPTSIPLSLQYKWVGRCKDCNTEVKTVEVDLDKASVMIAYCVSCDKKLDQKEVMPIRKQSSQLLVESLIGEENTFEKHMKTKKNNP